MITELITLLSSGKDAIDAGASLKSTTNKFMKHGRIGSISAFSSNSIFYFPIVVSDQLMPEEVAMVSRMIERSYASFVVACISLIPVHRISSDDVNSITEYLEQFHQNLDIGGNIKHNIQRNIVNYGLDVVTESTDNEDPDIQAAQEFILECWESSKRNDSDFVKLIAETVSVNDLFNEDAVDSKTRGIQKRFLAKRAELDTWGFIGEATDDIFDAIGYEDIMDHLDDMEAEEDYEYDPDSDNELDDDDYDDSLLEGVSRNKLPDSDFGLPKERKYPLNDARHVKLAVKMFGHCPEDKQKQLASAILKAAKKHKVTIKVSKKNPMSNYIPSSMVEAVVMKKTNNDAVKKNKVFSHTIATLNTITNDKIMSATSLTSLSAMASKLKTLKSKYTKYLNRYKREYEKTSKNDKVKLKIRFEKQTISDPKAFMKEYGNYIKIINQKLNLIDKRRAEIRKRKGISETSNDVNITATLSSLDLEAVDYCDRIISEALDAPNSEIFEYEDIEDEELNELTEASGSSSRGSSSRRYNRPKEPEKRGSYPGGRSELSSLFTENDVKRANDAVPLFTKATIAMETDSGRIINQDLLVGIKGYVHRAPTTDLVDDVYNCIANKRKFLRFVKFITGEEKSLADLLFGIKELKTDALTGEDARWKSTFKRRKRWSRMSIPYLMKEYTPNGTIVMTMNEVNFIKDQYGIDIMNMDHVRMIMDTDFLLGFVIVDQSEEIVYVRYDGHDYGFQTYTYAMLERETVQTDRMIREMYRAMSR